MQRLVDGDRAARGQRHALRAGRFILVGEVHFTKEHVRAVLPPQFVGAVGILLHPIPDLLHRHLIFRDDVAFDQDAADRRIGKAVMRVVIDADGGAVLEAHPGRALDLGEQQIGLVLQPDDFEAAAGNRAVLDFGAIVIRHQLAATDLSKHLALVGQARRTLPRAADEQIGRAAIDRHGVDVGLGPGAVDDGLVIAGNKALGFAEPRDAQGKEMLLEEDLGLSPVGKIESSGGPAGISQRGTQRLRFGGRLALRRYRLAACAERLVGEQMIVLAPAHNIGPRQRRILAAADFKRPGDTGIGQGTRSLDLRTSVIRSMGARCGDSAR